MRGKIRGEMSREWMRREVRAVFEMGITDRM